MKTSKHRGRKCTLLVAALLTVVGGCSRVSNINGEQVFEYEYWVPLATLLLGLMAIPLGWKLRNWSLRLACFMLLSGPLAVGLAAPSLYLARVVVGRDRFQVRNGMWWAINDRTFKFAEIDEIGLTSVTTLGRRGRKRTNEYLSLHDKSGGSSRVSIDNPIARAATGAILREAIAHGVRIRGARGDGVPFGGGTKRPDW